MNDQNNPFFSVIVPVYNKGPYIKRAINSILQQSFEKFELLIVCDPSTDNSREVVESFTDPRIRLFYRDEPGPGGYAARNLGIKKAKGNWICFLDADDEWFPNRLENVFAAINEYPDIHLFTSPRLIESQGSLRKDRFSEFYASNPQTTKYSSLDYLKGTVLYEHPFHCNTLTIRSPFAKKYLLFPEGRVARSGDLYIWVVIVSIAKHFVWQPEPISHLHKDVVGVSKTSLPSIEINNEMVKELSPILESKKEITYLKKYANRLIRTAWLEQKNENKKTPKILFKLYYFDDLKFSLFWGIISFLPYSLIMFLKNLKHSLKRAKST